MQQKGRGRRMTRKMCENETAKEGKKEKSDVRGKEGRKGEEKVTGRKEGNE